jgi:methylase of polypeptide subunit release factors
MLRKLPGRGELTAWGEVGRSLQAGPSVHRPSSFSAALAALLPDLQGRTVVDAGSGAGLVTIAALARGAEHVVALDYDPGALRDTEANVQKVVGATDRISLWQAGWNQLNLVACDVLLVNPPQRPTRLLQDVPVDQRHLHSGGGEDGLAGLRLVLQQAIASTVLTTGSSLLSPGPETLTVGSYGPPVLHDHAVVQYDSSWRQLSAEPTGVVNIWRFSRTR